MAGDVVYAPLRPCLDSGLAINPNPCDLRATRCGKTNVIAIPTIDDLPVIDAGLIGQVAELRRDRSGRNACDWFCENGIARAGIRRIEFERNTSATGIS